MKLQSIAIVPQEASLPDNSNLEHIWSHEVEFSCPSHDHFHQDNMMNLPPTTLTRFDLQQWSLRHNVTHSALSDLLKLLQPVVPDLPLDARSLMCTPRNIQYSTMENGLYHYIGIQKHLPQNVCSLQLLIHVDGLPLYKSSKKEFWTILGCIQRTQSPFPIAIFGGKGKPALQDFLSPLVDELLLLSKDNVIDIKKTIFLCDAPARAYIKCVKGHSGYSSCDRCEEVTDPGSGIIHTASVGDLRTDGTFRNRTHHGHHTGNLTENLLYLV